MEIFQEPTFTAFVALILSFVVAKIVSFAVSYNTGTDCDAVVCCADEGIEGGASGKGLKVGRTEGKKRVKFVGDVVVRRVDYVVGPVGEEIVGESGDFGGRADRIGDKGLGQDSCGKLGEEQCFDMGKTDYGDAGQGAAIDRGCEKLGMLIKGESDEGFDAEEENSAVLIPGEPGSGVIGDEENVGESKGDDASNDQREDGRTMACGENEGPVSVDEGEKREAKTDRIIVDEGGEVKDGRVDFKDDDDDDDDWEGIERSELEKVFAEAVNYAEYGDKEDDRLAKLGSDVQMELYALHKVAVEGPCHDPQPMALKVSARAKWNAWQRLGSMSREAAMEKYIRVLSDSTSSWRHNYSADNIEGVRKSPDMETVGKGSASEHDGETELGPILAGNSSAARIIMEHVQNSTGDTANTV